MSDHLETSARADDPAHVTSFDDEMEVLTATPVNSGSVSLFISELPKAISKRFVWARSVEHKYLIDSEGIGLGGNGRSIHTMQMKREDIFCKRHSHDSTVFGPVRPSRQKGPAITN